MSPQLERFQGSQRGKSSGNIQGHEFEVHSRLLYSHVGISAVEPIVCGLIVCGLEGEAGGPTHYDLRRFSTISNALSYSHRYEHHFANPNYPRRTRSFSNLLKTRCDRTARAIIIHGALGGN